MNLKHQIKTCITFLNQSLPKKKKKTLLLGSLLLSYFEQGSSCPTLSHPPWPSVPLPRELQSIEISNLKVVDWPIIALVIFNY